MTASELERAGPVIEAWRSPSHRSEAVGFAKEVVGACKPAGPARARALLLDVTCFVDWAIATGVKEVSLRLFSEERIERYAAIAMGSLSESSRRTRRANLRFVTRSLGLPLRPGPMPIPRSGPANPYTAGEVAAYFALARRQPIARRRAMEAMLCLGLGAGLDGADMRHVTANHVLTRPGGLVVVVEGMRPRVVPVLAPYHRQLLCCAEFSGESYLVGGLIATRKNVTTPVLERVRGGPGLERLSASRLRSTWLAGQIGRLGLHGLLAAAGLKSSQRLGDLAEHLEPLGLDELVSLLGGEIEQP